METHWPVAADLVGPPSANTGPVGLPMVTMTAVTPLGAFHEMVVIASPLGLWVAGFGLALMTPPPVEVPLLLSLVAAVAAEVLNKPFTPEEKNPPADRFAPP